MHKLYTHIHREEVEIPISNVESNIETSTMSHMRSIYLYASSFSIFLLQTEFYPPLSGLCHVHFIWLYREKPLNKIQRKLMIEELNAKGSEMWTGTDGVYDKEV